MHDLLNLVRIKDWLKNLIIFLPLIFSGTFFDYNNYYTLLFGFFIFCILSSTIYIFNDILDVKKDKLHPYKKKSKPIASGRISLRKSLVILLIFFLTCNFLLYIQPSIYVNVSIYILIALSYNLFFKRIPFIEIILLSLGYVVRIDTGSVLIGVQSSYLMLIATFFLGSFFILIKRISEMNEFNFSKNIKTREVLNFYSKKNLNILILISFIFLLITIIIYIITKNVSLILSLFLLTIFLYKYYNLSKNNSLGENPITLITNNKYMLILAFLILFSALIIYI